MGLFVLLAMPFPYVAALLCSVVVVVVDDVVVVVVVVVGAVAGFDFVSFVVSTAVSQKWPSSSCPPLVHPSLLFLLLLLLTLTLLLFLLLLLLLSIVLLYIRGARP